MADAMEVPLGDENMSKAIEEAQSMLSTFQDQDWLIWVGKTSIPGLYEDVEVEWWAGEEKRQTEDHEEVKCKVEERKREEEEWRKRERERRKKRRCKRR